MAYAITTAYSQFVLEVEFSEGSGVYDRICGITDVTVTRTANTDTDEVPDCGDQSLPHSMRLSVRSLEMKVTGTGKWALSSHRRMLTWWRSALPKNVRLRNIKVENDGATGDPIWEEGPCILVSLGHERTKGSAVTASIELQFDGLPELELKA